MLINLKTKIWLTIFTIVLMFSFFTLYYFPRQQGILLVKNYNDEIQNLANTVALGVRIAINEQNFEGVETALNFVKGDRRLQFVSILDYDTIPNLNHSGFHLKKTVFETFPGNEHPNPDMVSNDSIILKKSPFKTSTMSGEILLGFNTKEITESQGKIRTASLIVSSVIFFIGIFIGFLLARNISVPVLALRDAANRVGDGDLNQKVRNMPRDEIGQLGTAFNKMIDDLATARKDLYEKNIQLSATIDTLNNTLVELKNTQSQLIQSEKMASLGDLTAGIAHEIQNPLNFVNNFSEVNTELIDEMHQEIQKGNFKEAEAIAKDIKENEQKIAYHGKRADAIVKGMLQHSRRSSGIKELTDLNKLADEYLRLSYHGLRAKDKSFNATMHTDFDKNIEKIKIIPQEIGRVLLNLFTNAFYAVTEKKLQQGEKRPPGGTAYEPTISVITKKINDKVEVRVKDNGNGIPKKILDKIFQPFFTTKPTGQGTGLGLSLSYDIVKTHDGEMTVETKEGEGAEFVLRLPGWVV